MVDEAFDCDEVCAVCCGIETAGAEEPFFEELLNRLAKRFRKIPKKLNGEAALGVFPALAFEPFDVPEGDGVLF